MTIAELIEGLVLLGKLAGVWAFLAGFKRWIYDPVNSRVRQHFAMIEQMGRDIKALKDHIGHDSEVAGIAELRDMLEVMTERQRILMHDDDRGMFETNAAGETTWVNQRYCNLVGRTTHESLGFGWKSFVHESERGAVTREWASCVKEGREFEMEISYKLPDGRVLTAAVKAMVMRGARQKRFIGHIGFLQPLGYRQDEPKTKHWPPEESRH